MGLPNRKIVSGDYQAAFDVQKMDRYLLVKKIAQSFSAEVFLGGISHQTQNPKLLIIKLLHSQRSRPDRDRARFFREIKMNKNLVHPNIARTIDFGEFKGEPYIVMEWIEGKDLRQLIHKAGNGLLPRLAAWIIHEVASGLIHLNESSIVHRDLSPHNVMLSYSGDVKIIDFGVAKAISVKNQTLTDGLIGKPNYLSPEQASGGELDPRSDIFSLGSIFFELLTGEKAFDAENEFAILEKIKACETFDPTPRLTQKKVPQRFVKIIQRCLRRSPEDRFTSAQELVNSLNYELKEFPDFSHQSELSDYACDLFSEERGKERKEVSEMKQLLTHQKTDISYPEISLSQIQRASFSESGRYISSNEFDRKDEEVQKSTSANSNKSVSLEKQAEVIELVKNTFEKPTKTRKLAKYFWGMFMLSAVALGYYFISSEEFSLDLKPTQTIPGDQFELHLSIFPEGGAAPEISINRKPVDLGAFGSVNLKRNQTYEISIFKQGYVRRKRILSEPSGAVLNEAIYLDPLRYGKVRIQTNRDAKVEVTDRICSVSPNRRHFLT